MLVAGAGPVSAAAPDSLAGAHPARSDSLLLAPPDTLARADTLARPAAVETLGVTTVPRALRAPRTLPKQGLLDQPRMVMLRSLLIPGWGQAHNRAWLKAALVAVGDGMLRVRFVRDERRLGRLQRDAFSRLDQLTSAVGDTTAAGAEYRAALASGDQQRIDAALAALNAANIRVRETGDAYNVVVSAYNTLLDTSIRRRWVLGGVVLYALIDAYVDAHFRRFDVDFQFDPALPGGSSTPGMRLQLRWSF